jgi:hypothetical protein
MRIVQANGDTEGDRRHHHRTGWMGTWNGWYESYHLLVQNNPLDM